MMPFMLFPRQEEYLLWRRDRKSARENGLNEKSRGAGATWLNVVDQCHHWLFTENFSGSFGSRKADLVDKLGDPDSILEKARILLRYLPRWMLPPSFDWDIHSNYMRMINPDNGSTITGEAGDNIGRGGRSTVYDWDEVAYTERPEGVERALSENTDTIYYTSTVNGHNFFYKKRSHLPDHCIFRSEWKDDPRRSRWELWKDDELIDSGVGRNAPPGAVYPWYEDKKSKFDEITIAIEIDINYGASVEGIYIPGEWVAAAVELELPESGPVIAAMDVAASGKNSNVLGFRRGPVVRNPHSWQGIDTTQTTFKAKDILDAGRAEEFVFDVDGVGEGVLGPLNAMSNEKPLGFRYYPFRGGSRPSDMAWQDGRRSYEKFGNARAECYGIVRERFRKTYEYVNDVFQHPADELISIPNNPQLIAQLSQPKEKRGANGKIYIESKVDMAKRGIESPDHADMCVYLFAPVAMSAQVDLEPVHSRPISPNRSRTRRYR